jgi:hypothetical protein
MKWRTWSVAGVMVLVAAVSLSPPGVAVAGEHVRSNPNWSGTQNSSPSYSQPQPAPAPVVRLVPVRVAISVVATPPQPAQEPVYVNLRGPDGQVRRFPVEGGRAAIQSAPVVVLRPGQSVTIRWVAAR